MPGVVGQQAGQHDSLEIGQDLGGIAFDVVNVRDDADHRAPVGAGDRRRSARHPRLGGGGERHLDPSRRADTEVLDIAQRASAILRIAHHDLDIVAAALDPLRLFAVERLADLAAPGRPGSGRQLGLGLDPELQLLLAGTIRVGDVGHAGIAVPVLLPSALLATAARRVVDVDARTAGR